MTLAEKYDQIGYDYGPNAKELKDFEEKFRLVDTVFSCAGWSGFSLIFMDGSVWGLSHNLSLPLSYSTHFHDKYFNS